MDKYIEIFYYSGKKLTGRLIDIKICTKTPWEAVLVYIIMFQDSTICMVEDSQSIRKVEIYTSNEKEFA